MSEINTSAVTGKVMGMMTEAAGDSERVDKSIDDTLGGGVKAAGGKAAKEVVKKIEDMVAEQKSVQAEEAQQPDNGKKTKQETEKPAEKPEKKNKAKKDRDIKETGEKQKSRNPAKDARTGTRRPVEKIKEGTGEKPGPGQTLKPPVKEVDPGKDNPLNPVRTGMKRPVDKLKEAGTKQKDTKDLVKDVRHGNRRPLEMTDKAPEKTGQTIKDKSLIKDINPGNKPIEVIKAGGKLPGGKFAGTEVSLKNGRALRKKARDKAIDAKTKAEKAIDKAATEVTKGVVDAAGKTAAIPTMGASVAAAEAAKKGLDKAHDMKSKAFDKIGEAEKKAGDMSDNIGKSVGDKINSMTKTKGMAIISGKGSAVKKITDILK